VADVHEMIVMKNFFIDLKIPYSAVRNEQIEIKAVIHNFYSRKVKVRLEECFYLGKPQFDDRKCFGYYQPYCTFF